MELRKAQEKAEKLMSEHLSPEWTFKWNNRKTALGLCSYRTKTIQLSRPFTTLGSEEDVTDTILHEIAHAIAGSAAKHGPEWKKVAVRLGAIPKATKAVKERPPYSWLVLFGDEIVYGYYRKPSQKTIEGIANMYIPGRKEETLGKLRIEKSS